MTFPKSDLQGRVYAQLSNLNPGDIIQVDSGFTCIDAHAEKVVKKRKNGELYICCHDGQHSLEGQLDYKDGDNLIGIYMAKYQKEQTS